MKAKIYRATQHEKVPVATIHHLDRQMWDVLVWELVKSLEDGETLIIEPVERTR